MLKFLLGNAKTRNASVPTGVASDNRIIFSPVLSPRNRQAENIKKSQNKPVFWRKKITCKNCKKIARDSAGRMASKC